MDACVDNLLKRYRARSTASEALRERALAALPELMRTLRDGFGARRVVLFGSLADGRLSEHPDIDLLVEGIEPARLGEAAGRLFLLAPLPVDLVPLESGRREIVERALREDVVLHGE